MGIRNNERGATSFYAIWLLLVTAVLLVLIVNIVKVYAAKEQASVSAEQAALAATDVVYESVRDAIDQYDSDAVEGIISRKKLKDKIKEKKKDVLRRLPGFTESEAEREAIDQVLSAELRKPSHGRLRHDIFAALQHAITDVKRTAKEMIEENGGKVTNKTTILYFNDDARIEITSEVHYEESTFGSYITGSGGDLPQKAVGPKIDFVLHLNAWHHRTLTFSPHEYT